MRVVNCWDIKETESMQKNDIFNLEITDIGVNGEGIGKVEGYTVFVKDAVIGDVIEAKLMKAKKNYGYARLVKILTPSPDRVAPVCPMARKCGGCQIQAMSYKKQLEFKEKKVRGNLARIGPNRGNGRERLSWRSVLLSEQSPVPCRRGQGGESDCRILRRAHPQHHPQYKLCAGGGGR